MRIGDLLPLRRVDFQLPVSSEDFLVRISGLVKADSLLFVNYWEHKGEFVGKVTQRGFLIRRFIRKVWVPLIFGRVSHGAQCGLSVWFFAPEATVFLATTLALAVVLVRALGAGGLAFPLLFAAVHFAGCLHFQKEITLFVRAAGIEDGGEAAGELGSGE
jgi:hypothetical protein